MKTALVTGAASGLGASLTRALLAEGWRVIGVDLQADAVRAALSHPNLVTAGADLADAQARACLVATHPAALDLVAHCAGTSAVGPFELQTPAGQARVIAANLVAPIALTQALLVERRLAPGACVMLAASLSCYVGYPGASVYAATKDGLAAYGRSLAVTLALDGAHCLTVFPGPMRTAHARRFAPADSSAANERARMHPDRVAAAMLAAMRARKTRLVIGAGPRLAAWFGRLAPMSATALMARTLWPKLRASSKPAER